MQYDLIIEIFVCICIAPVHKIYLLHLLKAQRSIFIQFELVLIKEKLMLFIYVVSMPHTDII